MTILITGGNGMLARTLRQRLAAHTLIPVDLPEVDITSLGAIDAALAKAKPDVVIHCAAMTAVDACETNAPLAYAVNEVGSRNVAIACRNHRARLIAISTDYVFRGDAPTPYTEADAPDPQTIYGKSKLAGERAILHELPAALIARTAWLYGPGGPSFIHTMLKLAETKDALKVVDDQHGNPTTTLALADALATILEHPQLNGIAHLTCEGETTWCGLTRELFAQYAKLKPNFKAPRVLPCTTAEYPRPAPRPANSRLAKTFLAQHTLPPMPQWQDALAVFLQTLA